MLKPPRARRTVNLIPQPDGGWNLTGFLPELAGVESNPSSTYQYTGTQGNQIIIQVMQSGYIEYLQDYTIPSVDTTLNITLVLEENT